MCTLSCWQENLCKFKCNANVKVLIDLGSLENEKMNRRNQSAEARTRVGAIKKNEYERNRESETKYELVQREAISRAHAHTIIYLCLTLWCVSQA